MDLTILYASRLRDVSHHRRSLQGNESFAARRHKRHSLRSLCSSHQPCLPELRRSFSLAPTRDRFRHISWQWSRRAAGTHEKLPQIFGLGTDTVILDLDAKLSAIDGFECYRHTTVLGRELDRVGSIVVEDLLRLLTSATIPASTGSTSVSTLIPLFAASARSVSRTSATTSSGLTGSGLNSNLPASILERSSTSLINCRRCFALPRMSPKYSLWLGETGPTLPSCISSAKPMTPFRGVRSSWDILARNSLLSRLAS